jgi:hypothetical protein
MGGMILVFCERRWGYMPVIQGQEANSRNYVTFKPQIVLFLHHSNDKQVHTT